MNREIHPLAGKIVLVNLNGSDPGGIDGKEFIVEDWWININGTSWQNSIGNPAAMSFAIRSGFSDLPFDDEVVYGKVGPFGHILHTSELKEV